MTSESNCEFADQASLHEKYIITQNETLHKENKKNFKLIQKLKHKLEEESLYNERSERRISDLKAIQKNFHEIDKLRQRLYNSQTIAITNTRRKSREYYLKARKHLRILECILIVFLVICFETLQFKVFISVCGCLLFIVAFQESSLENSRYLIDYSQDDTINKINEDIAMVVKSQDYIYEYIESR